MARETECIAFEVHLTWDCDPPKGKNKHYPIKVARVPNVGDVITHLDIDYVVVNVRYVLVGTDLTPHIHLGLRKEAP